jgi:protein gp37
VSAQSSIEWTDRTWNPVRGCSRVSPGCDNCYAMRVAHRFSNQVNGKPGPYQGLTVLRPKTAKRPGVDWSGRTLFVPAALEEPLRWRKPQRIFVNSMSDLFHESLPFEQIAAVFGVMAACPQHTFQVLTKRPKRAAEFFGWLGEGAAHEEGTEAALACGIHASNYGADVDYLGLAATWPLPNVWLGVSAEDQATYNARVPLLAHHVPAALKWVSAEPLLGPLQLRGTGHIHLGWLVVGGESGAGARPFDTSWALRLIAECHESGIPIFVKQLGAKPFQSLHLKGQRLAVDKEGLRMRMVIGEASFSNGIELADGKGGDMAEWPEDLRVREFPR